MVWVLAIVCAILLLGISVLIHFECLAVLQGVIRRFRSSRCQIITLMVGLLIAHIVEIWVYAGTYYLLIQFPEFGAIQAASNGPHTIFDLVYFSAMVYTTVGFGDMVPTGGFRLITATEALVGLSLIAWSASFTYFQLHDQFGRDRNDENRAGDG